MLILKGMRVAACLEGPASGTVSQDLVVETQATEIENSVNATQIYKAFEW